MDSIQLIISATEEQQDILISQLQDLETLGFEQTENCLIAYFPENNFDNNAVNKLLEDYKFTIHTIEEKNWNEVWESNFQPVVVDDFCAVRADFHEAITNTQHEIIITPKMSFGTGHHATTYMMMQQMKSLNFINKSVFDFGTGTGILAILAQKMGASKIKAIDVDEWSIENAKENIARNNSSNIIVELSSQIPKESFDIILANINRNIILQYLPELKAVLHQNGSLLLSGLLTSDQADIIVACTEIGLGLKNQTEKNNWISLLFVNSR